MHAFPLSLCNLAEQFLLAIDFLVAVLMGGESKRLALPQPEYAEQSQAPVKQAVHYPLQGRVEIDQHVPAENHVELVEGTVGSQVVLRENDAALQGRMEQDLCVRRGCAIVCERAFAPRRNIVLAVPR